MNSPLTIQNFINIQANDKIDDNDAITLSQSSQSTPQKSLAVHARQGSEIPASRNIDVMNAFKIALNMQFPAKGIGKNAFKLIENDYKNSAPLTKRMVSMVLEKAEKEIGKKDMDGASKSDSIVKTEESKSLDSTNSAKSIEELKTDVENAKKEVKQKGDILSSITNNTENKKCIEDENGDFLTVADLPTKVNGDDLNKGDDVKKKADVKKGAVLRFTVLQGDKKYNKSDIENVQNKLLEAETTRKKMGFFANKTIQNRKIADLK
ncbi:MAG: hypothetical protein HQK66_14390, partial [Desulfamplus sp.]|nr:hypothetical protein [Desulfamplus sp.]